MESVRKQANRLSLAEAGSAVCIIDGYTDDLTDNYSVDDNKLSSD